MAVATELNFAGSANEQALARRIWEIMVGQGSLFGRDAQIKQTVDNLAAYIAAQDGGDAATLRAMVDAAVQANPGVFSREERDSGVVVTTSRRGVSGGRQPDRRHMFATRLYEPSRPLPVDDINNIVTTVRPPLTTVEPVQVSNFWRNLAGQPPLAADAEALPSAEPEEVAEAEEPEEAVAAVELPVAVQPAVPAVAVAPTTVLLADGTTMDLQLPVETLVEQFGAQVKAALAQAFNDDPERRVVGFGETYYNANALPTFGKNDLRRIQNYIVEQGEPTFDTAIISDLYREQPGTSSFEIFRFGLNYRLSREKDYEFVGSDDYNLWLTKGSPSIDTKRVKPGDLGQMYSYLVEGFDATEPAADGVVNHYLTPFEWEYGILPFTKAFASIFPRTILPEQRGVVILLEVPQQNVAAYAETRIPVGNRGGWIWGFEELFHEFVVPGTLLTFSKSNQPNVLNLSWEEIASVEDRLLQLEEKRNRFVFAPVTYTSAVDEDLLPNQKRYGKLRNLKVLPWAERRRPDAVIAHVFETLGEQLGTKEEPMYWIHFNELLLGVNVLRPASAEFLLNLLGRDAAFYADEATVGAYYYKPAPLPPGAIPEAEPEVDEDEEE